MQNNKDFRYTIIFFRFAIASIILIVNTALFDFARVPVYFLISAVYVLTIIYLVLLLAKISGPKFFYLQIVLDLVIVTAMIHYTDGIDSVLSILYPITIIAAGIVISPRASVVTALLGSIFYSVIVSLEYFGVLPFFDLRYRNSIDNSYFFSLLYFRVTVFCIIGFLSAYICQQLKKRDLAVMSLKEQLGREDRLLMIGKFAASAAHEIRNPLASISGCVESLKESIKLEGNNAKLFDLILKETARLNNIINGMLEYVKPGKLNIEKVIIDDLVEEVVFLVKSAKEFNPQVEIIRENRLPGVVVSCDAQQIKQVFFNLLVNAIEAIPVKGQIIIRENASASGEVKIEFADNGPGIPEEIRDNLFEPFASGKQGGIGLGLSIAANIVKEHGGSIEVESEKGRGTTFRVRLPKKAKSNEDIV